MSVRLVFFKDCCCIYSLSIANFIVDHTITHWMVCFFTVNLSTEAMTTPQPCKIACSPTFCSSLLKGLHQLHTSQSLTDFTIKVKGKVIPCHKVVLAAACPYFSAMFSAGMKEVQEGKVCLDHLDEEVVRGIAEYFYSGNVQIGWNKIKDAIEACEFLQLIELKKLFGEYIHKNLTTDNCISWYKFSDRFRLQNCCTQAKKLMCGHFEKVSKGSEFKSLSLSELVDFIKDEDIVLLSKDIILKACMEWVHYDSDTCKETLLHLLPHVGLTACSLACLRQVYTEYQDLIAFADVKGLFCDAVLEVTKMSDTVQKKLVIIGGLCSDENINSTIWHLDQEYMSTWNDFGKIPTNMHTKYGAVCHVKQGFVFLGGRKFKGRGKFSKCFMYDISADKWSDLPRMPIAADELSSVAIDDNIYILGGLIADRKLESVYHLDLGTQQWHTDPSMLVKQQWPIACSVGSNIYVSYNSCNGKDKKTHQSAALQTWLRGMELQNLSAR